MTRDPRRLLEHKLQGSVMDYFRLRLRRGVMGFSIPNELPKIEGRLSRFARTGMKPGVADILLVIDGKAHFLELKAKGGVQSLAQKSFEMECEANGVPYRMAHSFEQAVAIAELWGAVKVVEREVPVRQMA